MGRGQGRPQRLCSGVERKVLTIEMTEKQISGRNISLHIDYEDVLAADSFDQSLLEEE